METITLSPKFQVVIPKAIRQALGLEPGQKLHAVVYKDRIELIPIQPLKKMRGFLAGIDISVPRDRDRVWTLPTPRPGLNTFRSETASRRQRRSRYVPKAQCCALDSEVNDDDH